MNVDLHFSVLLFFEMRGLRFFQCFHGALEGFTCNVKALYSDIRVLPSFWRALLTDRKEEVLDLCCSNGSDCRKRLGTSDLAIKFRHKD